MKTSIITCDRSENSRRTTISNIWNNDKFPWLQNLPPAVVAFCSNIVSNVKNCARSCYCLGRDDCIDDAKEEARVVDWNGGVHEGSELFETLKLKASPTDVTKFITHDSIYNDGTFPLMPDEIESALCDACSDISNDDIDLNPYYRPSPSTTASFFCHDEVSSVASDRYAPFQCSPLPPPGPPPKARYYETNQSYARYNRTLLYTMKNSSADNLPPRQNHVQNLLA